MNRSSHVLCGERIYFEMISQWLIEHLFYIIKGMSLLRRLLNHLGLFRESAVHQYELGEDFPGLTIEPAQRDTSQDLWKCWQSLSPREQEVTALVCLGYTNGEIASKLKVSPTTIKSHVRNVLPKFQVHSKVELRIALREWDFEKWDHPPYH